MIKRYSDHAANERTFLAWVRTAIAVMAFGFVIERFDLFLQIAAPQVASRQLAPHNQWFANIAGLAFIVVGVAMIVIDKLLRGVTNNAAHLSPLAVGLGIYLPTQSTLTVVVGAIAGWYYDRLADRRQLHTRGPDGASQRHSGARDGDQGANRHLDRQPRQHH